MENIRLEPLHYNNGQKEFAMYNGSEEPFGFLYYSQNGISRLKVELGERNYRTVVRVDGKIKFSELESEHSTNKNFDDVFCGKKDHLREIAQQLHSQDSKELLEWMIENTSDEE